jgi:hypothetical protein
MPKLVKLYIRNVIIGFVIAAAFVALLLWFNVMNLWHLVTHSDAGPLAVFLLWFMNGIVFAGVQFAWVIMAMAEKTDKDNGRGGTPQVHSFDPVPVRVEGSGKMRRRGLN